MPESPAPKLAPHPHSGPGETVAIEALAPERAAVAYAELGVTTNFSFLRGASHPEEFVRTAAALGHRAAAIADRNSLAGIVRAHVAAEDCGIGLAVGARLVFAPEEDAPDVFVYASDRASYGRLARLLTRGKRRAEKGDCLLGLDDLLENADGLFGVVAPPGVSHSIVRDASFETSAGRLREAFGERLSIGAAALHGHDDRELLERLARTSTHLEVPLLALGDVHYHVRRRRALQDVMTATRLGTSVERAAGALFPHAERHLKAPADLARLFDGQPAALHRAAEIAEASAGGFSLSELRYHYPSEVRENGRTALETLIDETWKGARERYGDEAPGGVRSRIEYEFGLIEELDYAPYFLTVHDIVRFARSRGIMCQGRGAAANSAVCYCLGVTAVDPDRIDLLFERFVSKERGEPPDIDIDFEHERREEVIQYIYDKYGREKAGLAATVITYRSKSAIREVGKVFGLSGDAITALSGTRWGSHSGTPDAEDVRRAGLDPEDKHIMQMMDLARQIIGFPRHLSQHVGGFVITRDRLDLDGARSSTTAMEERKMVEWDKDDLESGQDAQGRRAGARHADLSAQSLRSSQNPLRTER